MVVQSTADVLELVPGQSCDTVILFHLRSPFHHAHLLSRFYMCSSAGMPHAACGLRAYLKSQEFRDSC